MGRKSRGKGAAGEPDAERPGKKGPARLILMAVVVCAAV
jgi:hypothetical protein